jgi:hypothetical protein
MYKAHIFLDGKLMYNRRIAHVPRVGDIVRFSEKTYGVTKEVTFCLDEDFSDIVRVNIAVVSEQPNTGEGE